MGRPVSFDGRITTRVREGFEHAPKFVKMKNFDKFSLRRQAKPTNSFDNFF